MHFLSAFRFHRRQTAIFAIETTTTTATVIPTTMPMLLFEDDAGVGELP
jgi:hypothetical protein